MHQGELLHKYLKFNKIAITRFRENIDRSHTQVYKYFETQHFTEDVMELISKELGSNWLAEAQELESISKGTFRAREIPELTVEEAESKYPKIHGEFFATISPTMSDVITLRRDTFKKMPMLSQGEFMVQVTGNSMKGIINHGDWVAIRRIYDFKNATEGEAYLFVTGEDNLRTIKYLKKSSLGEEYRYMAPYNIEQFDGQDIHLSDIKELYKVIGLIRMVTM